MIKIVKYLWQFPQNILGIILMFVLKKRNEIDNTNKSQNLVDVVIIIKTSKLGGSGISLGKYVFISDSFQDKSVVISHEEGHCIQSLIFGPLYIIVVGLPSLVQNIISRYLKSVGFPRFSDNYYKRWPENWADKLGRVIR